MGVMRVMRAMGISMAARDMEINFLREPLCRTGHLLYYKSYSL